MSEEERSKIPKTLEELKTFAFENHIPLDKLHMHLGEDYPGPKAFGIYQDGTDYVVYKNKADGSRAIRYRGADEAYAVREIYLKMREMGLTAKAESATGDGQSTGDRSLGDSSFRTGDNTKRNGKKASPMVIIGRLIASMLIVAGVIAVFTKHDPKYERGYYRYHDDYYYSDGYDWYRYDNGFWAGIGISVVEDIVDNYDDYVVNVYEEGIEPYVSHSSNYDDDDDWDDWDDDDDWYNDNDWDYDYDTDWDWDSDW